MATRGSRMAAAAAFLPLVFGVHAAAPQAGHAYRIDPGKAQILFYLGATMHTVHGSTRRVHGEVVVESASERSLAVSGVVRIEAADLQTGNARRDRTMREHSLAVARHPEIVFQPRRLTPQRGASAFDLAGDLTIRGVTRPAVVSVEIEPRGDRLEVRGGTDVRWSEFQVPDPSFLFVSIDEIARVRFEIELVPIRR